MSRFFFIRARDLSQKVRSQETKNMAVVEKWPLCKLIQGEGGGGGGGVLLQIVVKSVRSGYRPLS